MQHTGTGMVTTTCHYKHNLFDYTVLQHIRSKYWKKNDGSLTHDPCDPSNNGDPCDPWPMTHRPIAYPAVKDKVNSPDATFSGCRSSNCRCRWFLCNAVKRITDGHRLDIIARSFVGPCLVGVVAQCYQRWRIIVFPTKTTTTHRWQPAIRTV